MGIVQVKEFDSQFEPLRGLRSKVKGSIPTGTLLLVLVDPVAYGATDRGVVGPTR